MQFFKSKGLLLGSESGADFAAPLLDWCENRHTRTAGETIPLWSLVFHDALVSARYQTGDLPMETSAAHSVGPPRWLEDMLWGYAALSNMKDYAQMENVLKSIEQTRHMDEWFAKIATVAMVNHRFLTADGSLEETTFSNGCRIVVNFAEVEQPSESGAVAGHSYRIYEPPKSGM